MNKTTQTIEKLFNKYGVKCTSYHQFDVLYKAIVDCYMIDLEQGFSYNGKEFQKAIPFLKCFETPSDSMLEARVLEFIKEFLRPDLYETDEFFNYCWEKRHEKFSKTS